MTKAIHIRVGIVAAALMLSAGGASATKLDDITCDALKLEKSRLETEGLKSDMDKGPAWAKGNLSKDRLTEIEQLIVLTETIAFRCPLPKPPPLTLDANGKPIDPANPDQPASPQSGQSKPKKSSKPAAENSNSGAVELMMPEGAAGLVKSPSATIQKAKPTVEQKAKVTVVKPEAPPAAKAVAAETPKPIPADTPKPIAKKPKVTDAYVPPPRLGNLPGEDDSPPETPESAPEAAEANPGPNLSP